MARAEPPAPRTSTDVPRAVMPSSASERTSPAPSVESPTSTPSRLTTAFTAPSADAVGVSSSHADAASDLCGMVTLSPAMPSARTPSTRGPGLPRRHGERDEHPVEAGRGVRRVVDRRRPGVRDRVTDDAGDARRAADPVLHGRPLTAGPSPAPRRRCARARRASWRTRASRSRPRSRSTCTGRRPVRSPRASEASVTLEIGVGGSPATLYVLYGESISLSAFVGGGGQPAPSSDRVAERRVDLERHAVGEPVADDGRDQRRVLGELGLGLDERRRDDGLVRREALHVGEARPCRRSRRSASRAGARCSPPTRPHR